MFFVLQSLEQLKGAYKENWETFLANSGLKVFFNLEDNFSRDYVSKLIGETEVVREVRSESEGASESESTSRSTARSQSESRGRSSSTGTSETEGTNSSTSTGKSWGVNSSESRSRNYTYAQGIIFRHYDYERIGDSRSQSQGKSRGWTEGESHGVSHGTSRSTTDGTSETSGTSISETDGTTRGTSQSRTSGASETIQKRALVTPDEIGQVFARIDDRAHPAYPGLALAVISGARPVALRRVNYYEDFQFMGLFDPHPDHPFVGPLVLTIESSAMGKYLAFFGESYAGLRIKEWSIKTGQMVAAGERVAMIAGKKDKIIGHLRAPKAGMIGAVLDSGSPIPEGPLFSTRYFDDGSETIVDPFSDLARFAETYIGFIREQKRSATLAAVLFSAFAGIALFMAVIGISPVWCVLAGLGFAGVAAFMVVKLKAAAMVLAKCGSGQ
jgi:hypothetical protein